MIKCRKCGVEIDCESLIKANIKRNGKESVRIFKICKPCSALYRKNRYESDKERFLDNASKYRTLPGKRERAAFISKRWRAENPHKAKAAKISWLSRNMDKYREYCKKYHKDVRKNSMQYVVKSRIAARIANAIRAFGTRKYANTECLVGCSRDELVKHIESTFKPGMSWENRREWDIDHIRPCASFDLTDPQQQKECFHFSNLTALWASENRAKGCKY